MIFQKKYRILYLLFIIAVQYIVRFFFIRPNYAARGIELQIPEWLFAINVLAIVLLVAGGFLIYDYYTLKQTLPVSQQSQKTLNTLYTRYIALTALGCALGLFAGWKIQFFNLGVFFVIYATLLYFYALRYKLLTFWGNFIIAFLTGWLFIHVWLFELFALFKSTTDLAVVIKTPVFSSVTISVVFYAVFYILLFFVKQMITDIIQSTKAPSGSKIFPVRYGMAKTKKILLTAIALLSIFGIILTIYFTQHKDPYFAFWGGLLMLCIGVVFFKVFKANSLEAFQKTLFLTDIIAVLGLASIILL